MPKLQSAIEVYKLLPRTNCRKCGVPACLAFAAAVFNGDKRLAECPHLAPETVEEYDIRGEDRQKIDEDREQAVNELKKQVAAIDLAAAAERLGAPFEGGRLKIKSLGKDFFVDSKGQVSSDCHIHPWVTGPLLNYVLHGTGKTPSGRWIPFRELKGGADWNPLYLQRSEKPLKKVADTHTGLFELMIHIFSGKRAPSFFSSDISIVLHPLPLVPVLICYWMPEDGMESSLNVFYDDTATENLSIDAMYTLVTGMVIMFEKVALTHG